MMARTTRSSIKGNAECGVRRAEWKFARWQEFFPLYGPMIRRFALKAGCTEIEADEVMQETAIGVARNLPEFRYDPATCRFKTWLLNQTAWRVKDQLRKRHRQEAWIGRGGEVGRSLDESNDGSRTGTVERAADPAGDTLDRLWETEWQEGLLEAALERVKGQFSNRQFQIFDLNVRKGWPSAEVARSLGVSLPGVYLAKHRVAAALKREVARLERLDS